MSDVIIDDNNSANSGMDRRRFIEYCAVLGIVSTLRPEVQAKSVEKQEKIVTVEIIEAAAAFEEFSRGSADDLVKKSHWPDTFRHRRFIPAVEYIQANRYRTLLIEKMQEAIKDIDVFVEVAQSNTQLTNLTGHPAVIVPCGFIDGRPIAIVFVGKLFGEADTLAVAKAYQDATDFHLKYPALSV